MLNTSVLSGEPLGFGRLGLTTECFAKSELRGLVAGDYVHIDHSFITRCPMSSTKPRQRARPRSLSCSKGGKLVVVDVCALNIWLIPTAFSKIDM